MLIILGQLDLFPELSRQVSPLNGLHVEIAHALLLKNGGISSIGQRTGVPGAQTSQVVLVAAKSLRHRLGFVRAMPIVYNLPDHVVLYHAFRLYFA